MARIFFVLACFATVLLLTNLGVGLWVGDLNGDAAAVKVAPTRRAETAPPRAPPQGSPAGGVAWSDSLLSPRYPSLL